MPTVMLLLGGLVGMIIGAVLGGGMVAAAGLPLYGPIQTVFAAILSLGPIASIFPNVITPIGLLFGAGLGFFVATIFVYLFGAIGSPTVTGAALLEFFSRGVLIGMASMVNWMIMSAIPRLAPFSVIIFIILLLSLIPPIAGNRFYERVIGALGWVLPLNYLMLPLGVALFIVAAPMALAMGGSVRFDFLTWSIETAGGAVLGLAPSSFNIGNFTFLPLATAASPFTTGVSAHETGHTLGNAVFGGFFYWIGAIDENVPPLRRGRLAYAELFAESHFTNPTGGPSIPMW